MCLCYLLMDFVKKIIVTVLFGFFFFFYIEDTSSTKINLFGLEYGSNTSNFVDSIIFYKKNQKRVFNKVLHSLSISLNSTD